MRESIVLIVILAIVGFFVFGLGQGGAQVSPAALASAQSAQAASAASNVAALAALQASVQAAQAQQAAQLAAQSAAASQASANQTQTLLWVVIGLPVLALAVVGGLACLTTARRWMRRWARRMARDDAGEPLPPARGVRRVAPPTRAVQVLQQAAPPLVVNAPTAGWGWDAGHHRDADED